MAVDNRDDPAARMQLCQALWDMRRGIARRGGARANQISFGRMLTDPDYRGRVIRMVRDSEVAELRELGEAAARCNVGGLAECPVSWDAAGRTELDIEELTHDHGTGRRQDTRGPATLAGTALAVVLFALAGGVLSYFFSGSLVAMLAGEVVIDEPIEASTTWQADRTYVLADMIYVTNDAVLTVEAGTTVKGRDGSALIVARDGELRARGKVDAPVVFTSAQPAGRRARGDWGGVVLLGNAPVNRADAHVEGVPPDEPLGGFGGQAPEGSCGLLEYTRVEFAGFEVAANVELNGLTLGGCGSATIVRNVQVHMGLDDGIEVFGGAVNLERVVVTGAGDDALDWDLGWTGNAQFVVLQQHGDAGDNAIEADNNRDDHDATPRSEPTIGNASLIGSLEAGAGQRALTLRRGTGADLRNVVVAGFPLELLDVRDASTAAMVEAGRLRFNGVIAHRIGPGGSRYAMPESVGAEGDDDDGGFDEGRFLRVSNVRLGTDPELPGEAYDRRAPRFQPAPESPVREHAVRLPKGEFWDEGALFLGAVDPEAGQSWLRGWTAFPVD